jgi:hypothetical protein
MTLAIAALAVLAAAALSIALLLWRRAADLSARLRRTAPYLIGGGASPELVGLLTGLLQWDIVDKGGDLGEGIVARFEQCPCQHHWTVATTMVPLAARPNKAAIPALLNYPAPAPADWPCKDDCIQVMTHTWQCWFLETDGKTWKLACSTCAQYHCKKPDDPDRNRPPFKGSPGPEL